MGATNSYKRVNATNVYAKGKADSKPTSLGTQKSVQKTSSSITVQITFNSTLTQNAYYLFFASVLSQPSSGTPYIRSITQISGDPGTIIGQAEVTCYGSKCFVGIYKAGAKSAGFSLTASQTNISTTYVVFLSPINGI
jgi:hypothetical protein